MLPNQQFLRVLNIEESESDSDLIKSTLQKLGPPFFLERVTDMKELEEALHKDHWDFIIAEFHSKKIEALKALQLVRQIYQELPFILVGNGIGEESVADMMKAGAEDFVSKCRLERLLPVVKRIIREQEIKHQELKARGLANKANAAKEQMLAIVSHDIKNPLSAIQLEAQMLLRVATRHGKSLLAEEVKIQANRILKTTERLKNLISDLLDKNKTENSLSHITKEDMDVRSLFQEVLDATRPLLQQKGIVIRSTFPPEVVKIPADKNKMFQVFTNLISNAIKFTPDGGNISLSLSQGENEFIFWVKDSGPGINGNELPKVFEKYWTGKGGLQGTGLGLFICKTIIEAHGGHIMVENNPEGGACFSFPLPKVTALVQDQNLSYARNRYDSKRRIMLIDDDEDLREVISWALSKEGYAVQSFQDPMMAVEFLKRGKVLPELILADYHMDGMQGGDFLALKNTITSEAARKCPVIMISASPTEVESKIPRELYQAVITKPLDLEGLVGNMKKYLP